MDSIQGVTGFPLRRISSNIFEPGPNGFSLGLQEF